MTSMVPVFQSKYKLVKTAASAYRSLPMPTQYHEVCENFFCRGGSLYWSVDGCALWMQMMPPVLEMHGVDGTCIAAPEGEASGLASALAGCTLLCTSFEHCGMCFVSCQMAAASRGGPSAVKLTFCMADGCRNSDIRSEDSRMRVRD